MTATAATLLVLLVSRPQVDSAENRRPLAPQTPNDAVVVVDLPAPTPHGDAPADDADNAWPAEPLPLERPSLLAALGLNFWQTPDDGGMASRAPYRRLLGQVLLQGVDSWHPTVLVGSSRSVETPSSYDALRNEMLGIPRRQEPSIHGPSLTFPFLQGVKS
jgi:hypothetical protein